MGNRARVFCGEPCTDEALFVNAFIQSLDHVRSALGVRFLVSDDRVRRIPSACLDVVETSASGEVQGNPAENFSIDARRPRDFNYDGVTSASSLHFPGTVVYEDFQPWARAPAIWSYCELLLSALNRRVFSVLPARFGWDR